MQNNKISNVLNIKRADIASAVYSLHQNFQPATASVERSFSTLKNLLAKDINF